jgi:hypothetical protein
MKKSVPAAVVPPVTASPGASAPGELVIPSPAPTAPATEAQAVVLHAATAVPGQRKPHEPGPVPTTGPLALALRLAFILAIIWTVIDVVRDGFTAEAAIGLIVTGGLGAVEILRRLERR